jgi:hypothetical protein
MNYSPIPHNDYPPEWDEDEPEELDDYGDDDE